MSLRKKHNLKTQPTQIEIERQLSGINTIKVKTIKSPIERDKETHTKTDET